MKLTNIKNIRKKTVISIAFLIILSLSLLAIGVIDFDLAAFILGVFLINVMLIFPVLINSLRCFEYENNRGRITIRSHSLLFRTKNDLIEFPKHKLLYFEINNVLNYPRLDMLQIVLFSHARKKIHLYFIFSGFNEKDMLMLENSLGEI
jgi:hypothetical protein